MESDSENTMLQLQHYRNRHRFRSKALRLIWNLVWFLLFRPTPRGICYGWRVFLLRLFGARIGRGCHVLPSARVWQPWKLRMGSFLLVGAGGVLQCG
jgi:putative colanic acid biosynthesis acetyltransferase WcaF